MQSYYILSSLKNSSDEYLFFSLRETDCSLLKNLAESLSKEALLKISNHSIVSRRMNCKKSYDIYVPWDGRPKSLMNMALNSSRVRYINYIEEGDMSYIPNPYVLERRKIFGFKIPKNLFFKNLNKAYKFKFYEVANFFCIGNSAFPFAKPEQKKKFDLVNPYGSSYKQRVSPEGLVILLPIDFSLGKMIEYFHFARRHHPFPGREIYAKLHPSLKVTRSELNLIKNICAQQGVIFLSRSTIVELELSQTNITLLGDSSLTRYALSLGRMVLSYNPGNGISHK